MARLKFDYNNKVKNVIDSIISDYKIKTKYKILLEENYDNIISTLTVWETKYGESAIDNKLFTLSKADNISGLTKKEMNFYFNSRLDKKRFIPLLHSDTCPICESPICDSVDHILPKDSFVQYTLMPINLVPMCNLCNRRKSTYISKDQVMSVIHPYFEDVKFMEYVYGKITFNEEKNFLSIELEITTENVNGSTSAVQKKHHHNFFEVYKLYEAYNPMANRQITSLIAHFLKFRKSLSYEFIRLQINSEYEKLKKEKYDYFNEQYVKYLVYETLNNNFNSKIYDYIIAMVESRLESN